MDAAEAHSSISLHYTYNISLVDVVPTKCFILFVDQKIAALKLRCVTTS